MLRIDAKEANLIPILDIARLVVPRFADNGSRSTGQCCKHTDNNLGNLRFKIDSNFAHCFTCDTTWSPVSLVMDFLKIDFLSALEYLYSRFPSYFTNVYKYEPQPKWDGLQNKEYKYLGISVQLSFGNIHMDIREFATSFPDEHDILLISKVMEKQKEIDALTLFLSGKMDSQKIQYDKAKVEDKLYRLLAKGLRNKQNKTLYTKIVS